MRNRVIGWTTVVLTALGVGVSTAAGAASAPDPNLVAAQIAAQRILSLVSLPAGALTQSSDPSVGGTLSKLYLPSGAQQVVRTQFWTVNQAPGAVSDYIYQHPPTGSRFSSEQGPVPPPPTSSSWQETRSFPGVTGRVTSELLEINVATGAAGGTAVRADAIVLWRPTWERVPATARAARVRLDGFAQRTVTGAALSRLRALVDTQPVVAPGLYACPAGFAGQAIQVTFVDAHGRTLAKVAANSADGCRWLSVRVGSRRGPALLGGWELPGRLWAAGSLIHCTDSQLAVSVGKQSLYQSQASATITVRNAARAPCSLEGVPSIELLTATGRRLPVSDRRVRMPLSVVTAPRHGALSADIFWKAGSGRCTLPVPALARIGLPGAGRRVDVTLTPGRHRLGPCTGRLGISPLGWI